MDVFILSILFTKQLIILINFIFTFYRGSQREVLLYDSKDLSKGFEDRKQMDTAPGVLIPHFDPDTHILGVSARGDRVMRHFELDLDPKLDANVTSRFTVIA